MISVIIPVYNCEKYIERCIKSVIAQSFKDFELIVVNDGSTDNTEEICRRFHNADSRIRLFTVENSGVAAARNFGMEKANGDYISFMDGDDYVPENYLEELYKTVQGADVAVCDISCIKNGAEINRFTCKRQKLSTTEGIELLLSRREINSGPCGKLFSKVTVDGIAFPPMNAYEDILFVLDAFRKVKSIAVTTKTEYVYDNETGGAMTGYSKHPTVDVVTMSRQVLEYLDQNKSTFTPLPEYTTLSHLMQHLQSIDKVKHKTAEQLILLKAIMATFRDNRKRIKKNPHFTFKERWVYLFAARGFWIKKGFKRILK
ncbi:MAG: glycosyltransferase family 2 protein [Clostridia bacterium]|nr:glycosyltransferase family 2 protein [Clostridia bacterium]